MSRSPSVEQVVLLLCDGARPDILQSLHEAGDVPAISRLLVAPSGGQVRVATSVFPSTTGPAHLPFLAGCYPGTGNIPGIRWLDPEAYRARRLSLSRFRSYMGLGSLRYDRDLSPRVRTVYEMVPDHASLGNHLRRGVRPGRDLTRWAKPFGSVASFLREDWSRLDRMTGDRLVRTVGDGTRFVFAALYAVDSCGHRWGADHERTRAAYRLVDDLVERLARAHPAGGPHPLVCLVSDHGQSDTGRHIDLAALVERRLGRCLSHPLIFRGLWNARSAVMVSGNAFAHVYRLQPREEPLWLDEPPPDVAALARELLDEDGIDHVIGRRRAGGAVVVSRRGRAAIWPLGGRTCYAVVEGADPFGYPPETVGAHEDRELLRLTWDTDYPDAPTQVLQILHSPRAGDLLVTSRPGFDLRARFEKPPHRGSHGSLHRLHMATPLLASHPLLDGPARTVDALPTLLDALGVDPPDMDGRSLWGAEGAGQ